jgi:hypothetical protein
MARGERVCCLFGAGDSSVIFLQAGSSFKSKIYQQRWLSVAAPAADINDHQCYVSLGSQRKTEDFLRNDELGKH